MAPPVCPTCQQRARLTNGAEIYPHRADLHKKPIYRCDGCGGHVGCHPGTTKPLGTPANEQLRKARQHVHSVLDPIWKGAERGQDRRGNQLSKSQFRRMARTRTYAYLAEAMGISTDDCHVGMFDLEQCRKAYRILQGLDYIGVRNWFKGINEDA